MEQQFVIFSLFLSFQTIILRNNWRGGGEVTTTDQEKITSNSFSIVTWKVPCFLLAKVVISRVILPITLSLHGFEMQDKK